MFVAAVCVLPALRRNRASALLLFHVLLRLFRSPERPRFTCERDDDICALASRCACLFAVMRAAVFASHSRCDVTVSMAQKERKADMSGTVDVGRLVDSNQVDDRKIIRLVKERRLLYARNNMPVASYYTKVKCLWEEVAREMGWSVADVRRKWSHIRNSYSRHLRNEMHGARTGKGRMVSRWYLADELEFLRDHMATDTRPSPYPAYAPTFLEMDLAESSSSEQVDVVRQA
ncbi:unnamed protein product, partial [Iphiclides podalirius]